MLALNHLQGRIPIVWTITTLTVAVSLAGLRTRLLPTWTGYCQPARSVGHW